MLTNPNQNVYQRLVQSNYILFVGTTSQIGRAKQDIEIRPMSNNMTADFSYIRLKNEKKTKT